MDAIRTFNIHQIDMITIMTETKFLADEVCSNCGLSRFRVISDGLPINAPVTKQAVLKCYGCGSVKVSGLAEDELHNIYHLNTIEPMDSKTPINFRGNA